MPCTQKSQVERGSVHPNVIPILPYEEKRMGGSLWRYCRADAMLDNDKTSRFSELILKVKTR